MITLPASVVALRETTEGLGFAMGSEPEIGALLAALVASKPAGRFLEIGTGTGLASAWMLSGMDPASTLLSIDTDPELIAVAERHLGADPRVEFSCRDGGEFLERVDPESYDLVFADSWPGKFTHLDEALGCLRVGGIYLVDDLLPQPTWPSDHPAKVERFVERLQSRENLILTRLNWSTGVMLATRVSSPHP